jgi:hypothetical protein
MPIPWISTNQHHIRILLKRYDAMDTPVRKKQETQSSSIHGRFGHKETTPSNNDGIVGARSPATDIWNRTTQLATHQMIWKTP